MQNKESEVKEKSHKNQELRGDSSFDLHKEEQQNSYHCVKINKTSSLLLKRQSIKTLGSRFANLPDELQTELSLKVAILHQKTVLQSEINVEICFRKLLQGFIKQKKEVNRRQTELEDKEEELMLERAEKDRLNEQIQEYRRFAGELRYKSDPVLVQTFRTKTAEEGNKSIRGLAILDKELFVVSRESSEIEVYDLLKLTFSRRWNLKELSDPWDIGSCNRNKCFYLFDYESQTILKVGSNGKLVLNWSTGVALGSLSVTDESNVLLTAGVDEKIIEYSPDGRVIRKINISYSRTLWHSVKLTNGRFVVCHGSCNEAKLSIVDEDGKLVKSVDGKLGFSSGILNDPIHVRLMHLSVDGNGFMMGADYNNGRILLLDSDLKFKREILSRTKHGLQLPLKILLDESNGRLIVADSVLNKERILIFDFK